MSGDVRRRTHDGRLPMSEQTGGGATATERKGMWTEPPPRRPVASFRTYSDAAKAVDYLAQQDFPVERVSIVGQNVELVEQIVGRNGYGNAAARGAVAGGVTGALFGWIFGLAAWIVPLIASLAIAAYGLVFGAVIGALLGLGLHWLDRGHRNFASVQVLQPTTYELVADAAVADRAAAVLGGRA